MLASQRWRLMVEEEHAQSDAMRGAVPPPEDHWRPYADNFRADPRRADDPIVQHLLKFLGPNDTLMDVGAGGGRLALPLALHCRAVLAVEPSASMASVLQQQAQEFGIDNVSLAQSSWEDAQVEPADLVLCSHVVYVIRKIDTFIRKLDSHARQRVVIVVYNAPPQSQIYPLWQLIHGRERLALPSLPQLLEVLEELGIDPQVDELPPQPARGYDTLQQAVEQISRRLYLAPGSPEAARLEQLLPEMLVEKDGVFQLKDAKPLRPSLVWWRPKHSIGR